MYTEDDLNDFGLRKTQFSQRIYENDLRTKLERNLQSMEKLTEKEPPFLKEKEKSLCSQNSSDEVDYSGKRAFTYQSYTSLSVYISRTPAKF